MQCGCFDAVDAGLIPKYSVEMTTENILEVPVVSGVLCHKNGVGFKTMNS